MPRCHGADGYPALVNQADTLASRYRLHPYRLRHLLNRYGSLVHQVRALAADRPDLLARSADPLPAIGCRNPDVAPYRGG